MRAFLTFLFVLLLAWRSAGATVSAPTIVEISPSTPVTSPLYLTNVLKNLSNNMIIRLLPGTHTVQVFPGSSGNLGRDAHMRLLLKTNITIEGLGPQSVIFHAQTGNVFSVALCDNITFKNFSIIGTRPVGTPPNTELYAAFNCESNRAIVWDGLTIKNQFDHCIVNFGTKVSEDCVVKNSWFDSCANTNNWPASGYPGDGVGIHVIGSRMKILNNVFTNCGLCIEFEGETGSAGIRNTLIEGNYFVAGLEPYIIQYDTGPTYDGMYSDVTIRNNTFKYLAGHGVGDTKNAIQLNQMDRVKIMENHIEGAYIGIYYYAPYNIFGGTIAYNSFKDITVWPIQMVGDSIFSGMSLLNNTFTNAGGDGIYFASTVIRSTISGNIFDTIGAAGLALAPIRLTGSDSNVIERNVFLRPVDTLPGIALDANSDANTIIGNRFWAWGGTPAWSDAGAGNRFIDNWVGTNWIQHSVSTNTFGGTNVIWNVAAGPMQVVEVTNTMLLIVTNYTSMNHAQRSRLMLINAKATNCGVFVTTAGLRTLGPDGLLLASAVAAAHNSITNGRAMTLECDYIGTNLVLNVTHQR